MSDFRKRTDGIRITCAVHSLRSLASMAPRWRPDVSGALRQPPNTPRRQGGRSLRSLPDGAKEI
jgi:hypothetical protein